MSEPVEPPVSDPDFPRVYEQLRQLARQMLAHQRPGHTLQATALVHEAFLRMQQADDTALTDPGRYPRVAAWAMRNILIDHARTRGRRKRQAPGRRIPLDAVELASQGATGEILAVDEAIERLQATHPQLAELVRLRFFAGLTLEDAARTLAISERHAYRNWHFAKALLLRALRG
ncbi:MAG: sigma-70 family RNA polymerase sigma factor [Planctomycetes bacterium]|nr:sigma-70 family RNA polymerase sigma factor [Planctomycetota bacterium]